MMPEPIASVQGAFGRPLHRAAKHFKVAAEAGVVVAQNQIAIMMAKGLGVKRDTIGALAWFHVAASLGAPQAIKNRDALAASVTAKVHDKAKRRARAFRPHPPTKKPEKKPKT